MTSLTGKAAIVTGAASGMGRATAELMAHEGAHVVCLDVTDPTSVAATIGAEVRSIAGDIRDPGVWKRTVALALSEFGSVDILANVAGVVPGHDEDTVIAQTEEGWQRIIGINLTGAWLGMRAVLPTMVSRGSGRIVNVASVAALRGLPMVAAYSAAKAGVIGLTRQAAVDYGRAGVRVNAIAPGDIDTPMSAGNPPHVKEALMRKTPAGRQGTAAEIAAAIVFLSGPGADFVNGHVLTVDGGWSVRS